MPGAPRCARQRGPQDYTHAGAKVSPDLGFHDICTFFRVEITVEGAPPPDAKAILEGNLPHERVMPTAVLVYGEP